MGKIKFFNSLVMIALITPNVFLVFLGAYARHVVEADILGVIIKTITRVTIFGVLGISVYSDDVFVDSTSFTPSELGLSSPMFAVIAVVLGMFLGLFFSVGYLETREFEKKTVDSYKLRPKTYKVLYRVFASISCVFSVLGFVGLMNFISYIRDIQAAFPEVKLSWTFYYLAISFLLATMIAGYKLLVPSPELWQYLNLKTRHMDRIQEELESSSEELVKEDELEILEKPVEKEILSKETMKIKSLVENQKETAIPWLEAITQFPREQIEDILQNELDLIIVEDLALTKEEFKKRKDE